VKTIQEIESEIDFDDDGIKLELNLFNEGKYDCDELRTVVRNVGVRLGITNTLDSEFIITNIYLGIETNKKLNYYHYSSSLMSKFPVQLQPSDKFCVNYYGSSVRDRFASHINEQGFFVLCLANANKQIFSSKFSGDQIERFITELEDGEEANWGSKDYHMLDQEVSEIS